MSKLRHYWHWWVQGTLRSFLFGEKEDFALVLVWVRNILWDLQDTDGFSRSLQDPTLFTTMNRDDSVRRDV